MDGCDYLFIFNTVHIMFIYILLRRNNAFLHMDVFIFVVSWH